MVRRAQLQGNGLTRSQALGDQFFSDDAFVMALRFRSGIPVVALGSTCMHTKCKEQSITCDKSMDVWGDHCVACGIGGHLFTRHGALNHVLGDAGRVAGYTVLMEQVVPELAHVKRNDAGEIVIKEARIDCELFGHAFAPDHLLDGTICHPGNTSSVGAAARDIGHAAEQGAKQKLKRYPPARGKSILPCSMETWGHMGKHLTGLLGDLAGLASRRQRERGVQPTRWLQKWRTQISMSIALHIGRAIIDAIPKSDRYSRLFVPGAAFGGGDVVDGITSSPFERESGHGMQSAVEDDPG